MKRERENDKGKLSKGDVDEAYLSSIQGLLRGNGGWENLVSGFFRAWKRNEEHMGLLREGIRRLEKDVSDGRLASEMDLHSTSSFYAPLALGSNSADHYHKLKLASEEALRLRYEWGVRCDKFLIELLKERVSDWEKGAKRYEEKKREKEK